MTPARRRVVVDLGAATLDPLALRAAVELAELAGAEFAGLFVEDVNLFRLGSLPFATEIGMASAAWRPLATADVERMLRTQAIRLQCALQDACGLLALEWSFEVARGTPLISLLDAHGDVVVIPGTARRSGHSAPEQTLRQAFAARAAAAIGTHGPVAVMLDDGPARERTLGSALALARSRTAEMLVINIGAAVDAAPAQVSGVPATRTLRLPEPLADDLVPALRHVQVLFWPAPADEVAVRTIEALRRRLICPLVLVR